MDQRADSPEVLGASREPAEHSSGSKAHAAQMRSITPPGSLVAAESNQQDLLEQMKTDRQQKAVRSRQRVLEGNAGRKQRRCAPWGGREGAKHREPYCLGRVWRTNERATRTLALVRPMMVGVLIAFQVGVPIHRALSPVRKVRRGIRSTHLRASVCMMSTTPRHEVNQQHQSSYTASQSAHEKPHSCRNLYRHDNYTILNPASHILIPAWPLSRTRQSQPTSVVGSIRRARRSGGCRPAGFRQLPPLPHADHAEHPSRRGWSGSKSAGQ